MISNKKYVLAVVGRSLEEILLKDTHAEKSHNYCRNQGAAKYQDSSPDQSREKWVIHTVFCSGTNFYIQRR